MTSEQETAMYDQPSGVSREELVEKAAKLIHQNYTEREWVIADHGERGWAKGTVRAVLAVFEDAHTPTDAYGPGGNHENCYFMEHNCTPANVSEPGKTDIPSAQTSVSGQIPTDDERMVIYANSNVTRGKFAAAAVHAALTAVGAHHGGPVIVLGAKPSEIEQHSTVIRDAGKTEVEPGTVTAGTDFHSTMQDGSTRSAVKALTGATDVELDELGGFSDDERERTVQGDAKLPGNSVQGEPNPDREARGMSEAELYVEHTVPSQRAEVIDDFMTGWRTADRTRVQGEPSYAQVEAAKGHLTGDNTDRQVRAALRAAAAVQGGETR